MATASNNSRVQHKKAQQLIDEREENERRILLVGKSGHGKSSTGNSLLANKTIFPTSSSAGSCTKNPRVGYRTLDRIELIIYDTPGLFDTEDKADIIKDKISRAVKMASPGPHAFLIHFKIGGRFTDEEKKTIEKIQDMFGKDADKFCILVLTGEDNLTYDGKKIEDYLKEAEPGLKQLLERCQNRYITINNRPLQQAEIDEKLQQLLQMVNTMLAENHVRYYTDEQFQKAEQELQERERQYIEAEIQKKEAEEKALREKIRGEFQEREKQLEKELENLAKEQRQLHRNEAAVSNLPLIIESIGRAIPVAVSAMAPVAQSYIESNARLDNHRERNSSRESDAQNSSSNNQPTPSSNPVHHVSSEVPVTQETNPEPVLITGTPVLAGLLGGLAATITGSGGVIMRSHHP